MHAIAARLGFDLVSLRLELFGRRRMAEAERTDGHDRAHPDAKETGAGE